MAHAPRTNTRIVGTLTEEVMIQCKDENKTVIYVQHSNLIEGILYVCILDTPAAFCTEIHHPRMRSKALQARGARGTLEQVIWILSRGGIGTRATLSSTRMGGFQGNFRRFTQRSHVFTLLGIKEHLTYRAAIYFPGHGHGDQKVHSSTM